MIIADIIEIWNNSWPAGLTMVALGTLFALILLVASEKLKVKTDPKVEEVKAALPNIDCGACGYAGCASYAKAVCTNPELLGACAPGGSKTSEAIANILNLQVSDASAPKRPIVHCRAHTDQKTFFGSYKNVDSCLGANALSNVQACKFGCLGFGDCILSCKFDAIHVINGLATVDYEKCTGCGACAKVCPRYIIEMVPFSHQQMLTVACSNKENGKTARKMCKVGCIACSLCTKQSELFALNDNLARMDYENYQPDEKTETARAKCPTKVIVLRGKDAPEDPS